MAVVKSKRGESELNVVTNSRKLAVYTIKICTNEKNFPKRYRWCVTNEIVKNTNIIHSNILKANSIYVKDESDYKLRKRHQNIALAEIGSLLGNMDDFILIHHDKEHLNYSKKQIEKELLKIHLSLNQKKSQLFPIKNGIPFLGFTFYLTASGKIIKKILNSNVNNERRKLRKLKLLVEEGILSKEDVNKCYAAWKAHAKSGNTYTLIRNMDKFYKSLWEGDKNG